MRLITFIYILFSISAMQGQSLPSGEEIRAKVVETYRTPKRFLMTGTASGQSPRLKTISTPMTIAFDLPDKMRIEGGSIPSSAGQGFNLIVVNNKKVWMYNPHTNQYIYQKEVPNSEKMIASLENLTFIRYRGLVKPTGIATHLRTEKLQVKGNDIECYVIQIDHADFESKSVGAKRNTWWVDRNTYIIWKEDNIEWISKSGDQEIQTTVFDAVLLDKPFPKDYFVLKPPEGSIQLPLPKR